jgi:uncharacterized membrane protein
MKYALVLSSFVAGLGLFLTVLALAFWTPLAVVLGPVNALTNGRAIPTLFAVVGPVLATVGLVLIYRARATVARGTAMRRRWLSFHRGGKP